MTDATDKRDLLAALKQAAMELEEAAFVLNDAWLLQTASLFRTAAARHRNTIARIENGGEQT